MGTRLFPSSDDSNTNYSRTPHKNKSKIMMDQTTGLTKITCSFSYAYFKPLLCLPFLQNLSYYNPLEDNLGVTEPL
jgi:hypothetical protein